MRCVNDRHDLPDERTGPKHIAVRFGDKSDYRVYRAENDITTHVDEATESWVHWLGQAGCYIVKGQYRVVRI